MKKLKNHIYYESTYAGATVGAFLFSNDTVLVDAPLKPEDARAWLSDLHKAGAKPRRVVVSLDSHPDRTLGSQTLDGQAMAHREVVRQIRRRAAIFKALKQESGAEWEETPGLSGLRWTLPRLAFSEQATLYFDERELRVEPHGGPSPGACWLISPSDKVVFVGDALTLGEPPFLAQADITAWMKSLDLLLSRTFKDYTIIAGRGGKATARDVNAQRRWLKDIEAKLKKMSRSKSATAEIEKIALKLAEKFTGTAKRHILYQRRLKHGLQSYFARRYLPASKSQNNN